MQLHTLPTDAYGFPGKMYTLYGPYALKANNTGVVVKTGESLSGELP